MPRLLRQLALHEAMKPDRKLQQGTNRLLGCRSHCLLPESTDCVRVCTTVIPEYQVRRMRYTIIPLYSTHGPSLVRYLVKHTRTKVAPRTIERTRSMYNEVVTSDFHRTKLGPALIVTALTRDQDCTR